MKRLIKAFYFMLTFSASAHAPIEHGELSQAQNMHEVRELILSFRQTGNDEYLETAWRLMQPELVSNASAETLLTYAFLSQSRHQFDVARDFINRALARKPHNNEAHLLLASIHLVAGRVEQARNSCGRLHDVRMLITVTCFARVAQANNQASQAYPKLAKLLSISHLQGIGVDATSSLAWAESIAGDLASSSDQHQQAIDHYRRSLALVSQVQVKAALADVLLASQQEQLVIELINHHETALPLLIRRLIALKRLLRSSQATDTIAILNEAFSEWIAQKDWLHAREMCRFYLDVLPQPELARMLAVRNIEIQKEREDLSLLQRSTVAPNTVTISPAVWSPTRARPKVETTHEV